MKTGKTSLFQVAIWRVLPLTLLCVTLCGAVFLWLWPELLSQLPPAGLTRVQAGFTALVVVALLAGIISCWLCMRLVNLHATELGGDEKVSQKEVPPELAPLLIALENCQRQQGVDRARVALMVEQVKALQPLTQAGGQCASLLHEVNTPAQFIGDNLNFLSDSLDQLIPLLDALQQCPAEKLPATLYNLRQELDLPFLQTETRAALTQSVTGVEQIARLADSARCWLHPGRTARQLIQLDKVAEQAILLTHRQWSTVAELKLRVADSLPTLRLNRARLLQVLVNLLVNASDAIRQASRSQGLIELQIARCDNCIELRVRDNGTGIPASVEARLFEPFVTSKPPGRGTGLGLSICRDIIESEQGGTLSYRNSPGHGAMFTVRLPLPIQ